MDSSTAHIRMLGDLHFGSSACREDLIKAEIEDIASDPDARVIVLGDLINNNTKSSIGSVFEDVYTPYTQELKMVEMLKPIADKIDLWVNGNHERRSGKDTSIDISKDMAMRLGVEDKYVGNAGIIRYILPSSESDNVKCKTYFTLLATHGAGGGKKIGSGINNAVDYAMGFEGIDGFIMGHTHKPNMHPETKVRIGRSGITRSNILIATCTSWQDYEGYPVIGMMRPCPFCRQEIILRNETKNPSKPMRFIEGKQSFHC